MLTAPTLEDLHIKSPRAAFPPTSTQVRWSIGGTPYAQVMPPRGTSADFGGSGRTALDGTERWPAMAEIHHQYLMGDQRQLTMTA